MLEVGVMFWAAADAPLVVGTVKELGVTCGQLGIAGEYDLTHAAADWREALAVQGFRLQTVFAAFTGEDYADIPTVERTVGFIPAATRAEREQRLYRVSDFAEEIGVRSIACHIGFVPEDRADPNYLAVRDLVRRICDYAAAHGQTFALETGQEPAGTLRTFLQDVERPNLGINFDPANMILYGTGDPIEALDVLGPHVISVHAKDGDWPPADRPGALGTERRLGEGAVGMPRFLGKLKEVGYDSQINIEREGQTPEQWREDQRAAVALLKRLLSSAASTS